MDGDERVIEFVREAGCEDAEALEPVILVEALFELLGPEQEGGGAAEPGECLDVGGGEPAAAALRAAQEATQEVGFDVERHGGLDRLGREEVLDGAALGCGHVRSPQGGPEQRRSVGELAQQWVAGGQFEAGQGRGRGGCGRGDGEGAARFLEDEGDGALEAEQAAGFVAQVGEEACGSVPEVEQSGRELEELGSGGLGARGGRPG